MRRKQIDQADPVVRVSLPQDDTEAALLAIEKGNDKAVEEIDRVNTLRKGKLKLRSPIELAFLDAAGNKLFVFPEGEKPQIRLEEKLDASNLPRFIYVVASDARGQRIVVRLEFERASVQ